MREKIVAVVPAYNEAGWISRVLGPLKSAKETGIIQDILVVDDGSSDNTALEVLDVLDGGRRDEGRIKQMESGCGSSEFRLAHGTVIMHPKNMGKSRAFITAARYCVRENATIMFITDADMTNLSVGKIRQFLDAIIGSEDIWMIRARYVQGNTFAGDVCPVKFSGFRAVRKQVFQHPVNALETNRRNDSRFMQFLNSGGFALEVALEDFVPEARTLEVPDLSLFSRPCAGASPTSHSTIFEDVRKANEIKKHRTDIARKLNLMHTLRYHDPNLRGKSAKELREKAETLSPDELKDLLDHKAEGKKRLTNIKGR